MTVVVEMRHLRPQHLADRLERLARRQWLMEIAALRRREQLDADDGGGILDHADETARAMCGHRNVVFLVGGGRDGVDRSRISLLLVFRNKRSCRHLRDHEAGIEPGLRREESRHARKCRVDQHGDAPFRKRADLADGKRDHVGGERHRLGVEVTARKRCIVLGEDQWVVGNAIGLGLQRVGGLAQHVQSSAHHLWLAAQAIRVLNTFVADTMGFADGAAGHQTAQGVGRFDLAAMLAQQMNARVEWRIGALGGIGRQAPATRADW